MTSPILIPLWPDGSPHNPPGDRPLLECYLPEAHRAAEPAAGSLRAPGSPRGAVIICAGGGYAHRAPHEGEPVARLLAEHGLAAFVCHYRVAPHRFPAPYADGTRAVRLVRSLADDYDVDPQRVAIMGFSAGGHLAATVATQPGLYVAPEDDLADRYAARPDRVILGYPVISLVEEYHAGSAANLLGENASEEARRALSNEFHVTQDSPPAFLFHTADDPSVPVSNSIRYAQACLARGVPVELHVYRSGRHGVGLAADIPALRSWPGLLLDWLADWTA